MGIESLWRSLYAQWGEVVECEVVDVRGLGGDDQNTAGITVGSLIDLSEMIVI